MCRKRFTCDFHPALRCFAVEKRLPGLTCHRPREQKYTDESEPKYHGSILRQRQVGVSPRLLIVILNQRFELRQNPHSAEGYLIAAIRIGGRMAIVFGLPLLELGRGLGRLKRKLYGRLTKVAAPRLRSQTRTERTLRAAEPHV